MTHMSDFEGRVLGSEVYMLGEGPSYEVETDTAWWFDILGKALLEFDFQTDRLTKHRLPFMASVIARIDEERQLIAAEDGLYVRERRSGALHLAHPLEADISSNRSNDGRVHPCGALWIGTMSKSAESGAGKIYHFANGIVRTLYHDVTIPNSICFSPDGRIGYFTDTMINKLMRVELDPKSGLPIAEPSVLIDHADVSGGLDGSIVDADGVIWNARWGSGRVDAYAPDGSPVKSLSVPAKQSSCPAFVGKNANRLLVTSAFEGYSNSDIAADPLAGSTFLLNAPVNGRFEPAVRL